MSLLIKVMKMPKGNDAVTIIIFPNGKVSLAHDRWFAEYAEAVPVPPHGRLIDADALIKEFHPTEEDENNGAKFLLSVFMEVIKAAPTVIPAEEGE